MKTEGNNAIKHDGSFTVRDWKSWPEGERWELIGGEAYAMSPAPRLKHQRLLLDLAGQLTDALRGKPCEPFISPFDVYLGGEPGESDDDIDSVVQPDLMIVCDPGKCREEGIFGAPDWILEVLSPSTTWKDQTEKRGLYERFGVREYWILNPDTLDLAIYRLEGGAFQPPVGATLKNPREIGIFPGLVLSADRVRG